MQAFAQIAPLWLKVLVELLWSFIIEVLREKKNLKISLTWTLLVSKKTIYIISCIEIQPFTMSWLLMERSTAHIVADLSFKR